MCGTIPTEEVEMEILMEEDDNEFSSGEEEVEEDEKSGLPMEVTSPEMPVEKKESTSSLGFSQELSSILASKMITLNDNDKENVSEITKKKETISKETGKVQQRRKPPPPPTKPKV